MIHGMLHRVTGADAGMFERRRVGGEVHGGGGGGAPNLC